MNSLILKTSNLITKMKKIKLFLLMIINYNKIWIILFMKKDLEENSLII